MSATPEQIAERLDARMQEWNRYGSHTPGHLGFFGANEALAMGEAAALIRAQAERVRVLEIALRGALPFLEAVSEDVGYGFARPDNPHDFSPDRESCNEDEIAAHKAACEAYDRGEYDPASTPGSLSAPGLHILRAPWGIGSYTMRDERIVAAVEAIRKALKAAP